VEKQPKLKLWIFCYNLEMPKHRIFLFLSLSFILGIFIQSFFKGEGKIIGLGLLIFFIIILAIFWKNKMATIVAFSILFLAFGIWRTELALEKLDKLSLDGQKFSGLVMISKEPESKENYQKVIVVTDEKLKLLVNAPLYSELAYGDEINLQCNLKIVENFADDFDY